MSFLTQMPVELYDKGAQALRDCRIGGVFDLGTAHAMAWLSQLSYETDRSKIDDICGRFGATPLGEPIVRSVHTALPIATTHAIIVDVNGTPVVAFAGTDPVVLANWISDFDIRRTEGGAAEGFATALDAVKTDILDGLPPDKPLAITGHSLGGALAVLLARHLAAAGRDVAAVYTFGMPRPGGAEFARTYNESALGSRTYRLVHGDDIVPTVAPSDLGFRHTGCYLRAPKNGRFGNSVGPTGSDEPAFIEGIAKELRESFHNPLAGFAARSTSGTRTDLAGVLIDMLPPRVRDHMPDRYIAACS